MPAAQADQARHMARKKRTLTRTSLCDRLLVNGHVITPSMRDVLEVVESLVRTGSPMLNNPLLGERAGERGRGRPTVLRALRRLSEADIISIEHRERQRRVTMLATGRSTDWGEARPGHSPFSRCRPGEPPPAVQPMKARRPSSTPSISHLTPDLEPPAPEAARRPQLLPESIVAPLCQYPKWRDGERPGKSPIYCNEPALGAASFCREHAELCTWPKTNHRSLARH